MLNYFLNYLLQDMYVVGLLTDKSVRGFTRNSANKRKSRSINFQSSSQFSAKNISCSPSACEIQLIVQCTFNAVQNFRLMLIILNFDLKCPHNYYSIIFLCVLNTNDLLNLVLKKSNTFKFFLFSL